MSFFDSKEEVLNIELTSYGKLLLSRGLLKPAYYSFHDDDILYDSQYASITEITSNSENRIQENTVYLKPFYSFVEPKPYIQKDIEQEKFLSSINNFDLNKVNKFNNSLGDSTINNLFIPSWKIKNLSSTFSSISNTFTDKNLNIPQLNCILSSSFNSISIADYEKDTKLKSAIDPNDSVFSQENFHFFASEELLLSVEEMNVDFENDIFEIQVYKTELDSNGNENYIVLKNLKNEKLVNEEGFLQDYSINNLANIDDQYAENYFEINVDKEIENITACKYILKTQSDQDQIFNDISVCDNLNNSLATKDLYSLVIDRAKGKNC